MSERWYLVRLYYHMGDLQREEDPTGDHILVNLVRPAMQHVLGQGWARYGWFMRFSQHGYHIQFRMWGDENRLQEQAEPYLRAAATDYCRSSLPSQPAEMELGVLAQRLNYKWGGPKEHITVRQPGAVETGLMYNTGEEEIHESAESFEQTSRFNSDACLRSLDLLAAAPQLKDRKTFVRLLMDDFFRLADLSQRERFYILTFCQLQWIKYFALDEATLAPYHAHYLQMAPRYQQYFAQKRRPEDSLIYLTPTLRPLYQDWIAAWRASIPHIIRRDAQGQLSSYDSLRLLTIFHLTHNRLGIGLLQEMYMAHLLAEHYRTFLTPDEAEEVVYWANQNVKIYGEPA